ncbi:hypothetical protein RD792_006467 [Penstemon davidsonii]|uniref:Uncharacterized protein n=1 Tax=Penstemon davidsonii TaxID=160366 RepID=A0ABR0DD45_9LAMI|nr:hypothetical protein RD792_006467 [Penstemon davidsonii]
MDATEIQGFGFAGNSTCLYMLPTGQVVLEGNSSINCNDNGVAFVEAKVQDGRQLSDMIEEPNLEELKHFLPTEHFVVEDNNIVFLLQVNPFTLPGPRSKACYRPRAMMSVLVEIQIGITLHMLVGILHEHHHVALFGICEIPLI